MHDKTTGFTLIELMIVMVIIGLLLVVALPAYQQYTLRTKATELLTFAAPAKLAIAEYYLTHGRLPMDSDDIVGLEREPDADYITAIDYRDNQLVISATIDGQQVVMLLTPVVANRGMQWLCTAEQGAQYLPASCR